MPTRVTRLPWQTLLLTLAFGAVMSFNLLQPVNTRAAVSDNLNFQARLEGINGAIVNDGDYNVEFKLYSAASGGSALWTEDYLNSATQGVRIVNGYLTVNLGSITAFPGSIAWDQSLYITLNIGGTTGGSPTWDGEMTPRLKLTSVPYAFQAKSASQLQVSNGANVGTLSFTAPTATRNILLPDASGTVCLNSAAACGFAPGTANSYIQNGTSLQSNANFNIQTTATGSITAVFQALTGQTADLLRFENAAGTAALSGFNSSGQLYYQSGSYTGTILQDSLAQSSAYHLPDPGAASDTFCLLGLANCTGTGGGIAGSGTQNYVAKFDTAGGNHIGDASIFDNGSFVGVGTTTNNGLLSVVSANASQSGAFIQSAASATVPTLLLKGGATPATGGSLLDFQDSTGALLATITSDGSILTGATAVVGSTTVPAGTVGQLTVVAAGGASVGSVIRAGASQTGSLLQLQDSGGLINASFSAGGNQLTLGRIAGSGTVTQGKLILADGTTDNFALTLQGATLTANNTITVPNAGGADTFCLLSLANCTGTGGGIAGAGTQYYIAKFDTLGGNHIGDASLYDNGSFVGLGTTTDSGLLSIQGSNASQPGLFVHAAASATTPVAIIKGGATPGIGGDLLQLQLDNGSVVASFDAAGNFLTTGSGTIGKGLTVTTGLAANTGLIVQGASSQTADLFNLRDNTGANLLKVDAGGNQDQLGYLNTPFGGFGQYGNLLNYSEQLDNGAWVATNVAVTANDGGSNPAPDGTTTAEKLVSSAASAVLQQTYGTANNGNYTFSVWLKTNSGTQPVALRIDSAGATPATGTPSSFTATTTWQRFSVTQNFTGTPTSIKPAIIITNNAATIAAWGGQLVSGTSPKVYTRTSAASLAETSGLTTANSINLNGTTTVGSSLSVLGAGGLTVGVASATQGILYLANSTNSNLGALVVNAPSGSGTATYELPSIPGGTTDTICTLVLDNCQYAQGNGAAFVEGGNAFGTYATLGTNDNYGLTVRTNGVDRFTLDTANNFSFLQSSTVNAAVPATANAAGYHLTVAGGAANGSTTGNVGGVLALQGGAAAGSGNNNGGNLTLSGGASTGSGNRGNVILQASGGNVGIGTSSPSALLSVGSSSQFQVNGSGAIAATTGITLTGAFSQTYSSGSNASASAFNVTNTNTSATPNTVNAQTIALTGTNNTSSSNVNNGLNFANVSAATNNSFNGLYFGTGYNSLLNYNGTSLISGSGLLQNAAIDPSVTYSNLQKVGALNTGSITTGFGTISTNNNITTTTTVQGDIVNAVTGFRVNNGATSGHYLRGDGTNYVDSALQASDLSGAIFTVHGSSGTDQTISTGDTLNILAGSSGNLTTTGSNTDNLTVDIIQNPTFTGLITGTSSTTGLALTGTPVAGTGATSLFQLGSTIVGGNNASNGGTYFGINAPNSGAGSAADFLNFQVNGTNKVLLTNAGNLSLAGTLGVTGSSTFTGLGTFNNGLTVATGNTFTNASSTLLSAVAISNHLTGGDIGSAAATVDVATTFDVTQTTAGQSLTLPNPTSATSGRIVYVNSLSGNASFTMYGVTIAASRSASFIWNGSAWVATSTGGTGVNTIGTVDSQSKSANGAVISGSTLYMQSADASFPGLVTTSAQTFAGDKTFNGDVTVSGTTGLTVTNAGSFGTGLSVLAGGANITGASSITYSSTGGTGLALNITNSATTGGSHTVNGSTISLTGTTNNTGTNVNNALSFANVTPLTGNSFTALNFGTGYNSLLTYNGTSLISGSGLLQNSAIDSSLTYSNLQKVGALNAGSITSGFGTISTGNNISTTATVQGDIVNAVTGFRINNAATTGHYLRGDGTNYVDSALQAADLSGTIFTVHGSSGTDQAISSGDTLNILAGSSGNLTTTGSNTDNLTVDIISNPTFTGLITGSSSTTGLALTGTPVAGTGTTSLLRLGGAIVGGNSSTDGGTYIGINQPSSGAGSAADFLNFQNNGNIRLQVTTAGNTTVGGTLNVTGAITAPTSSNTINGLVINSGALSSVTGYTQGSGNFAISGGGTFGTGTGAVSLNGNTSITGSNTLTVGTGSTTLGGILSVTGLATFNGGLTVINGQQLTNAGSTLLTAVTINDLPTGGDIGTAAATVDGATTFNIDQTTPSQALTLPTPTSATAGRLVYINNIGSTNFSMYGATISTGGSQTFIWNGTAWSTTIGSGVTAIGTIDTPSKSADGAHVTGNTIYLQSADASFPGLVTTGTQTFAGNKTFNGITTFAGNVSITGSNTFTTGSGTVTIGSLGAGLVQSSSGGVLSSGAVDRNSATFFNTALSVGNGGTGVTTLTSNGVLFGNGTGAVQATAAGTDAQFLLSNAGTPVFRTLGGDASITNAGSLTVNKLQGNTLTISSPATGQYIRYNGSAFVNSALQAADLSGTIFTVHGSSGTDQPISSGDTLNILAGSSNNLTTTGSNTDNLTVDIIQNPTFTGTVTTSNSSGVALDISGTPTATATVSLLKLGGAIAAGNNTASTGGTYIGINEPSSGAGSTADFLNFQNNNNVRLRVTSAGNTTVGGTLNVGGAITAPTSSNTINGLVINSGALSSVTDYSQGSGNFAISGGGTFSTGTGAISLNGNTSVTGSNTLTVGTGLTTLGGALNVTGLATFNGGLTVINGQQLTNAGSTLFTAVAISNHPTGGDIGTAASTVDSATTFNVNQTTASQSLTLPSPTSATAGRLIYINNVGSVNFSMYGATISTGGSQTFLWNGTAWSTTTGSGVTAIGTIDTPSKSSDGAHITGNTLYLQSADASFPGLVTTGTQTLAGDKTFTGVTTFSGNVSISGSNTLTVGTGTVTLGSLGAGLVQSSSGGVLSSGAVDRNSATFFNTTLTVANGGTGAGTFTSKGLIFGNGTSALGVTNSAANSVLVTDGSSNPSLSQTLPTAVQGNITQTGALSAGSIASGFGTISTGNNISTTATVQGDIINAVTGFRVNNAATTGHYLRGNGTNYVDSALQAADITGTVFTVHGSSGTDQAIAAGDTLNILAGSSGNLTTTGSNTDNLTVDIIQNPTFTGTVTASNSSGVALAVSGTPTVSATQSLVQIGNAIAGGNNTASTGGTYIGINEPSSGAGSTADFLNFQNNNNVRLRVTTAGNTTVGGTLNVGGAITAPTSSNTINGLIINAGALSGVTDYSQGSGNFAISGSGTFSTGTGAISLNGNTSVTGSNTLTVGTGLTTLGGALTVTGLGTFNGGLTVATGHTFTNASSTLLTALAISDVAGGGNIGTAATTVDVATTFNVNQTTASQNLTLPNPTSSTGGRLAYVNNVGSVSFTMGSNTIAPGSAITFMWNGSVWVPLTTGTGTAGVNTIGTIDTPSKSADGAHISGSTLYMQSADASFPGLVTTGTQTFAGNKTFNGVTTFAGNVSITGSNTFTTGSGTVTLGSLGAGLVQSGSGGVLSSGAVDRNSATFFNTALTVANGGTGATTLTSNGILFGNGTGAVQATAAGTDAQFLLSNAGTPVFRTLGGDATITNAGSLTVNKLQGNTLTLSSPSTGQYIRYNGSAFVNSALQAADLSGTIFTVHGSSGTDQPISSGDTLNILAGSSGNLTTTGSNTDNLTVDIIQTPTFTGTVTTSNSSGVALDISGTPTATATLSLLKLGGAIAGGNNTASTGGTYIGINEPSSGAGSTADFINFQNNGNVRLRVTSAGNTTVAGTLDVTGNLNVNTNKFQVTASNGNTSVGGTLGVTNLTTLSGGLTVTNGGDVAFQQGNNYSTTGSANDVNFGSGALFRLTGSSAQTITGIAGGADGRIITLVNAASQAATISNQSASSSAANRIITGTGADMTLGPDTSVKLVYDSTTSRWRVVGGVGGTSVTAVGTIDTQTKSANGAVIAGNAIYLQTADASSVGLVSTTTQTFAGNKTFSGTVTIQGAGTGLSVTNNASIGGTAHVVGNFDVNTNQFTVNATNGNTLIAGDLAVNGSNLTSTNTGTFNLLNTNVTTLNIGGAATTAVNIGNVSGAVAVAGSFSAAGTGRIVGNFDVNTNKFTVNASNGNTLVAGTLDATGNFNVNTNKFQVTAASGNTTIAGTLGVTGLTTLNGGLTIGASAGSGTLLTNNGATVNSTLALGNFGSGGSIGSAASTVDIYTAISIAQTTASQTLTIPSPTANTSYGRVLYVSNIGSQSFSFSNSGLTAALSPGTTTTLVWSNTNGGASWQYAGADGSSILNQNSVDQTANFRISGTGRANTSFTSPVFDALSGGTLSLGTSNATAITIGASGITTTNAGPLTVTGLITGSSSTTGLSLTGTPVAGTGITSLLQLGNAISGGNSSTNGGTYIGINEPSSGAGTAADFINFQNNGSPRLKVTSAGIVTTGSTLNVLGSSLSPFANNNFVIRSNFMGGSGNVLTDTSAPSYSMNLGNGATDSFTLSRAPATAGAPAYATLLTVSSAGALTTASSLTVQANGASITGNSSVTGTLGVSALTTLSGGLTVTSAGAFQNDRSTIFTSPSTITDKPTGGNIGTAAATVDVATTFNVNQTTASQTLTLPSPTTATSGRIALVSNVGSTNFTMTYGTGGTSSVIISPSNTATFYWNGTVWTSAGVDGSGVNYIQNQNLADQTANFRISGTGRANTSFTSPVFDALSGGTLSLGTSNATAISIGATGITTTNNGALTVTQGGTFNGGLTVANNSNFSQTGSGTHSTGTGAVSLNGDTTVASGKLLTVNGRTLNADADQTTASAVFNSSLTKNDSNTRTFYGVNIQPTINTGGSNANTTFNALNVDVTNTAVTGVTTNLLRLAYASSQKFLVDSSGNTTAAGTLQGTVVTGTTGFAIPGATTAGHYLRNNGTNFVDSALSASDISGTIFTLAGSTGTPQTISTGQTATIAAGASGNLTSVAGATRTVTVDIVQNPTFTGTVTTSNSSGVALDISGTPTATATVSQLKLGGAIAGGNNTAGTGGTYIGINEPSSGAGSTADFLNFQNNGTVELKVTSSGALTTNGQLTVNSGGATITAGDLALTGGNLTTGGSQRLSNGGALGNITGYTQTSGSFDASASGGTFKTTTGAVTLGGDTTVSANKSLTLATGTGQFSQTYSSGSASSAHIISVTNSNAGAGVTIQGVDLTPTNTTAPSSGTNTLNLVNFAAGGGLGANRTTNGLNFASATGYTNFINTPTAVLSSGGAWSGLTGLSSSGTINFSGLTASRAVFTDGSSNLTSTAASAALLNSLSDETGTGVAVFDTSPSFTTSILTGSTSFNLLNSTATTINFAGAATTLGIGAAAGTTTINGHLTVAGGKNLTLSSGSGQFSQTYTGTNTDAATITANSLTGGHFLNLANNTSTYTGTAIFANFANGSGTFSGNFADFQKNGVSQFAINDDGTLSVQGNAGVTASCSSGEVITGANYYGGIVSGGTCSSPSGFVTLQNAYDNSGSSDPQFQLSNGNSGLKIRDASSSTITNLLDVADSAGTTHYFKVLSSGIATSGILTVSGSGISTVAGQFRTGSSSQFQIDAGGNTRTTGTLKVGTQGAEQFQVDASGNVSTTTSLTAGPDANHQLQVASSGTITNTYKNSANSTGATFALTNQASGSGTVTVNAIGVNLTGTAIGGGGTNIINGLNFANVTTIASNTFNGLVFGTGYNNLLNLGGAPLINGSGKLQDAAIDSSVTYSNLQKVGALNTGSITTGFGTISTGNNITTTAALQGNTLAIGNASSFDKFTVDTNGNTTALGFLKVGSTQQFQVDASGNTQTSGTLLLSGTGANQLKLSGVPGTVTNSSLAQFSNTAITGGVAGGTYLGINSPNGNAADFIDFQNNGTIELQVSSGGNVVANGSIQGASLSVGSTVNAGTAYKIGGGVGTAGNFLRSNGSTGFVESALQSSDGAGVFVQKAPSSTANNTVQPTGTGIVALSLKGPAAGGADHILDIYNNGGSPTIQAYFDSAGALSVGQSISAVATTNTLDIGGSSNVFRSGYFGTTVYTPAIATLAAATANGITIKPGDSTAVNGTGGALTLNGGDQTGTTCNSSNCTGGAVTIQAGSATGGSGTTRNGGSVSINAGTGNTANGNISIGNSANVNLALGTGTTGAISLGATGITTTNSGALTVTQLSTLNGGLTVATGGTFKNDRSSIYTAISLGDQTTANLGASAAATVDVATSITVNQTTASQTVAIFSPTTATAGRVLYLSNIGSASLTVTYGTGGASSVVVAPSNTGTFFWNGTVWTSAGVDGSGANFIQNQTTQQTNANFNIQARTSTVAAKIQGAASNDIADFYGSASNSTALLELKSTGNLVFNQTASISTSSGNLTVDTPAAGTLALGATSNTVNVGNTTAATVTTISGGTNATAAISLTPGTAGAIVIGAAAGTGNITLGSSTAAQSVLIGNGVNASAQTVSIANGASGANTTVNILSGVGTAGAGDIHIANNTRVNVIDLGNINPAAARSINIGNNTGTANAVVDTINVGTNPTTVAGGNTIHIGDGTPTGSGTNLVTIGSIAALANTTTIQGGNGSGAVSVQAATSGTISIGTTNNNVLAIGTAAVAGTITIGGTSTTGIMTLGQSTDTNSINIGSGATASGKTQTINIGGSTVAAGSDIVNIANTTTTTAAGKTVNIATVAPSGSGTNIVTIGSNAAFASTTTIQGGNGSGAVSIQSAASGTISIGTAGVANTVTIGNTSGAVSQTLNFGINATSGGTNAIHIGDSITATNTIALGSSSNTANTITLEAGTASNGVQIANGNTIHDIKIGAGGSSTAQTVTLGSTGSTSALTLQASGQITANASGIHFSVGGARTIDVTTQTAANTAGDALALQAATGNGTGIGGALSVKAGTGGATNANGGALTLQGGAGGGSGTTGSVIVKANGTDKTTAFQIQNSSGTAILIADTVNSSIGINTQPNTGTALHVSGLALVDTPTDSTIGFRVRNASSLNVLNVDTQNDRVGINTNAPSRSLDVHGTWGGTEYDRATDNQNTTGTITDSTTGYLVYALTNDKTSGNNSTVATYNLTGLPAVDGTFVFIHLTVSHPLSLNTNRQSCGNVQIAGGTNLFAANVCDTTGLGASSQTKAVIATRVNGTWQAIAGSVVGGQAADYAEWIHYTGTQPQPGEVLTVGDNAVAAKLSDHAYDQALIGVVSTNPYQVAGADDGHSVIIALTGRVPVKVSLENGPIQPGDALTSSSTPGVAMKATGKGRIIGTALGAYDGTQESAQVIVQLGASYNDPTPAGTIQGGQTVTGNLTVDGDLGVNGNLTVIGSASLGSLSVSGSSNLGNLNVSGNANLANLAVGGAASAATLAVGGAASLGSLAVGGNTSLNNLLVTGSANFAGLNVSGAATISSLQVIGSITSATLTVSGPATVGELKVIGSAEIGGDLTFSGVGQARNAITKKFTASSVIHAGDLVVADPDNDGQVMTTTTIGDSRVLGIAVNDALNSGDEVSVAIGGSVQVRTPSTTAKAGDLLISSDQLGQVDIGTNPTPGSVVGKALGKSSGGLIWILVTLR